MSAQPLNVAFIPLVDAAPLIVASEMGFDREEGIDLTLVRASSWSTVRDMLCFGRVDAAHLLSPMPVAMALGLGGVSARLSALMVMSQNGTVIGVNNTLSDRLGDLPFDDAAIVGRALVSAAPDRLRIGVPFPFSMHAELLYYWLSASGLPAPQGVDIRTVPPPLMADALQSGEIDAFCVGEPWGSRAVERGIGRLILPGRAIWTAAPEKVLAARSDWAASEPDLCGRLMRAVWKAGRWLGQGGVNTTAAELLSHADYLDLPAELIDRSLSGRLVVSASGDSRDTGALMTFFDGAATFPWRSQAAWIGAQMAGRLGLDRSEAMQTAAQVFRTDLYRHHLREVGALMPGASERIEGGIADQTAVASEAGRLILRENTFFDGRVFDPLTGM